MFCLEHHYRQGCFALNLWISSQKPRKLRTETESLKPCINICRGYTQAIFLNNKKRGTYKTFRRTLTLYGSFIFISYKIELSHTIDRRLNKTSSGVLLKKFLKDFTKAQHSGTKKGLNRIWYWRNSTKLLILGNLLKRTKPRIWIMSCFWSMQIYVWNSKNACVRTKWMIPY